MQWTLTYLVMQFFVRVRTSGPQLVFPRQGHVAGRILGWRRPGGLTGDWAGLHTHAESWFQLGRNSWNHIGLRHRRKSTEERAAIINEPHRLTQGHLGVCRAHICGNLSPGPTWEDIAAALDDRQQSWAQHALSAAHEMPDVALPTGAENVSARSGHLCDHTCKTYED